MSVLSKYAELASDYILQAWFGSGWSGEKFGFNNPKSNTVTELIQLEITAETYQLPTTTVTNLSQGERKDLKDYWMASVMIMMHMSIQPIT